ncbi:MAG TPA: efflux transporter outer membrane subunit [Myxococcota bacterium]|nr:efflux transporter outer membrane subunit [Myxococcota bacterium]
MRRELVAALIGTALVSGCAAIRSKLVHGVGPNYERPAVSAPPEYRGMMGPQDPASLADLPWWGVFGDPVLQRLIQEALKSNYDLQTAIARIEESRALVGVAASQFYPQIGYQAEASRQKEFIPPIFPPGPNAPFNAFLGALNVTWEFDVWGRIRRSTEAARANLLASEEARRGVMLTLVSDVATAYFQLIELDRELEITRESAETYTDTLELFTRRYVGGTDTKLSVSRAEAALDASAAEIAALRRLIVQQENALSVLLGTHPEAIPRGTTLVEQTMPEMPPGLPSDLLERRPDILGAEESMISANAQIGVAIANFFPTFGLSALYGGESGTIGNVFKQGFSVWNVVGNASGPIFQGGRLYEQYEEQKAFWDETISQYQSLIVQAFREVSDALVAESELVGERAAREKQVIALKEAVELSLLRYRGGRASYLDVLDAEQNLYPAEVALAQTQRDQLSAVVTLYKALGGGWKLSDAEWQEPH